MKTSTFIWHIGNIAVHALVFAVRFMGEGAWALGRLVLGGASETHEQEVLADFETEESTVGRAFTSGAHPTDTHWNGMTIVD
jgi:hypothetical protein